MSLLIIDLLDQAKDPPVISIVPPLAAEDGVSNGRSHKVLGVVCVVANDRPYSAVWCELLPLRKQSEVL